MKKVLLYTLCLLPLFAVASFAQQDIATKEIIWPQTDSALLSQGGSFEVSGELTANANNYFIASEEPDATDKKSYVKFGNFGDVAGATIYLGKNVENEKSSYYYGDLTAELVFSDNFTLSAYCAGPYLEAATYVGNVKTTISGNVIFTGPVYGGAYVTGSSATISQKSITLNITNGSYGANIYGAGYVTSSGTIKLGEGFSGDTKASSISITDAKFTGSSNYIIAGAYSATSSGVAIENGTSIYLGSGVDTGNNNVFGGSFAYRSNAAKSTITGGSSVEIAGATVGIKGH